MIELLEGTRYQLVSIARIAEIAEVLKNKPVEISLDLETTSLNPLTGKITTLQCGTVKHAFILDCRAYYNLPEEEKQAWRTALSYLLQACPLIVGHNLKFDWRWLQHHFGIRLEKVRDTMLQEQVIYGIGLASDESDGIAVNMEATGERYGLEVGKELQKWSVNLDKPRKFYEDGSYCFQVEKKGKLVDSWWKPSHMPYKEGEAHPDKESFVRETTEHWTMPYPEVFLEYCAQDVYTPLLIHSEQLQRLEKLELEEVAEIENRCLPVLAQMELDGCYVDLEKWQAIIAKKEEAREQLGVELRAELTPLIKVEWEKQHCYESKLLSEWEASRDKMLLALTKKYPEVQGQMKWGEFKNKGMALFREQYPRPTTPKKVEEEINLGSSAQLQLALSCMGIQVDSTDKEHLEGYKYAFPLVKKLLEWKWLDHFLNNFGHTLLAKIDIDQRIHPTYNQMVRTGRMSCSNPNWQQLPSHEPEETSVRRCVIAAPGNVLLTADLPNIEARILADISQDAALLSFFEKGGDLHCTTARLMFSLEATDKELKGDEEAGIKPLELKPGLSYRSVAKTINFGLVYGMSPFKLSRTLGVSVEEAKALFSRYFEAYPGVAEWLQVSPQESLERGYSLTLAGRKRFYPVSDRGPAYDKRRMTWEEFIKLRSHWFRVRGSQERQAKNAPIQGSNADITKVALILLWHKVPSYVRFVACVHDEIVLECPEDKAEVVSKLLAGAMYKACRKYLKRVFIPAIEVNVAPYWKK